MTLAAKAGVKAAKAAAPTGTPVTAVTSKASVDHVVVAMSAALAMTIEAENAETLVQTVAGGAMMTAEADAAEGAMMIGAGGVVMTGVTIVAVTSVMTAGRKRRRHARILRSVRVTARSGLTGALPIRTCLMILTSRISIPRFCRT